MSAISRRRPRLLPDATGYRLNGVSTAGFDDRPELDDESRLVVARLARRYSPSGPSPTQTDLLNAYDSAARPPVASPMLAALSEDHDRIIEGYEQGLYEDLDEHERRWVTDPSLHPDLPGRSYPLSIGDAEALTGATARQLRTWEAAGLLDVARFGTRRAFFRNSILRAMVLRRSSKPIVTAACAVARGNREGALLLRLIGAHLLDGRGPSTREGRLEAGRYLLSAAGTQDRRRT